MDLFKLELKFSIIYYVDMLVFISKIEKEQHMLPQKNLPKFLKYTEACEISLNTTNKIE